MPPAASRPTLIAEPGDSGNVDEVTLPEKPVLVLSGSGQWENAFRSLREAFGRIEAELARAGIAPAGRPIATFTQTTDDGFRFEAMIPVAAAPSPAPPLPDGMRFGATPPGKAYRFVHKGAYEDIDTTYDTVTTYLEAKDIVARDVFMEELVTDPTAGTDPARVVNFFGQPKSRRRRGLRPGRRPRIRRGELLTRSAAPRPRGLDRSACRYARPIGREADHQHTVGNVADPEPENTCDTESRGELREVLVLRHDHRIEVGGGAGDPPVRLSE